VGHEIERWIASSPTVMILQPTTLCPMSCRYCYLPSRQLSRVMTRDTAAAIASAIPALRQDAGPLEVVWHGGEPLAVGRRRFTELLGEFEPLRRVRDIRHKVQTGATLLDDAWCDLFERYEVAVGISIDGPRDLNRNRVDRGGHEMFDRIVAGVEVLRRRGVPFTTLAVIPPNAVGQARQILDFIAGLGCGWIGLNIEALEAANAQDGEAPTREQAVTFWRDVFAWALAHPGVHIRDVERLLSFLGLGPDDRRAANVTPHDLIPTISWDGDVVVLSPELLGVTAPRYEDFVVGNVTREPLADILRRAMSTHYVQEFAAGVARCQAECEFFAYCQGAHAGNRFFEHGRFTTTETEHCRASYQAPVLALSSLTGTRSTT
jgi:uncharacterized protein